MTDLSDASLDAGARDIATGAPMLGRESLTRVLSATLRTLRDSAQAEVRTLRNAITIEGPLVEATRNMISAIANAANAYEGEEPLAAVERLAGTLDVSTTERLKLAEELRKVSERLGTKEGQGIAWRANQVMMRLDVLERALEKAEEHNADVRKILGAALVETTERAAHRAMKELGVVREIDSHLWTILDMRDGDTLVAAVTGVVQERDTLKAERDALAEHVKVTCGCLGSRNAPLSPEQIEDAFAVILELAPQAFRQTPTQNLAQALVEQREEYKRALDERNAHRHSNRLLEEDIKAHRTEIAALRRERENLSAVLICPNESTELVERARHLMTELDEYAESAAGHERSREELRTIGFMVDHRGADLLRFTVRDVVAERNRLRQQLTDTKTSLANAEGRIKTRDDLIHDMQSLMDRMATERDKLLRKVAYFRTLAARRAYLHRLQGVAIEAGRIGRAAACLAWNLVRPAKTEAPDTGDAP